MSSDINDDDVELEERTRRDEREFWVAKFKHWAHCQKDGDMISRIKGQGFAECAQAMESNDRWCAVGVEKFRS